MKKYIFDILKTERNVAARLIMMLSLVVIMFAVNLQPVGSRSAQAGNFLRLDFMPGNGVEEPDKEFGKYFLSFSEPVKAQLSKESSIPLFYMDILGATIDANPFLLHFPRGPVKLVRLNQTSTEPAVVRATFFLRQSLQPSIKTSANSIEVSFSEAGTMAEEKGRHAYSLIPPGQMPKKKAEKANLQPLNIVVKDADPVAIFRELARRSGKSIHFRDPVKCSGQLSISASDPQQAMEEIASKIGAVLTEEEGDIWVSTVQNPLLKLSSSDMVGSADLSNLALGDILRALGQIAELTIILDKSLDSVKAKPVDIYLQKVSIRRAFETLLKVNDLVFNPIDDKTLLIMTASSSRSLEGKIVRVVAVQVPLAKLNKLAKQSISPDLLARIIIQEDLGNLVLIGDKEAVDSVQIALASIENKLLEAGDGLTREYLQPVNTKPADLIKMVNEAMETTENLKITMDERTDMLVISGSPTSVNKAVKLIKKLDHSPTRQALIHIRLVEVHRTDLAGMGLKFPDVLANVSDITKVNGSTIIVPAVFTAFDDNSKVKTLANPTLRCMDKEESTIDISEQIPVKSSVTDYLPVASSSLAARTSEIWSTTEIGIRLNIKPQIHFDKEVTMNVNVDLTELVSMVEGHPWTAKRQIKTRVRVKDKETVVIGGLMRNKKDVHKRPVPLLSKIPFLKKLLRNFESRNESNDNTEMVILITPEIVGSKSETSLSMSESIELPKKVNQKYVTK